MHTKCLSGNLKGRRGRFRQRWKDKVRIVPKELGWEIVHWMHLAQDRDHWRGFVNTVMNLRFP